jgi:hypothetical protein
MPKIPTIPILGLEWHLRNSPSQEKTIISPLSPKINFKPNPWDGESLPTDLSPSQIRRNPLVFFSLPPPPALLNDPTTRLIWIPMWDEARGYTREWWQALPKTLRVVAFSNAVRISAQSAGLPTLSIKYFENPNLLPKARWDSERVLFYWNRTGLVGPAFLAKVCAALHVDRLLFRRMSDPGLRDSLHYALPARLGNTIVQSIESDSFLTLSKYQKLFFQANIVIAPRSSEGVGLTYLEAMARGCSVFGFNAPTMNEYILHKINGYLLPEYFPSVPSFLRQRLERTLQKKINSTPGGFTISEWQNWDEIRNVDLPAIGSAARQDHQIGFESWQRSLVEYADFLLDW